MDAYQHLYSNMRRLNVILQPVTIACERHHQPNTDINDDNYITPNTFSPSSLFHIQSACLILCVVSGSTKPFI